MSEIFFSIAQNVKWTDSENSKQGFALDVIFQNETLFNFCLGKVRFFLGGEGWGLRGEGHQ